MSYLGNAPGVSSQRTVTREIVAVASKTAFVPISGYALGYVDVYVNGLQLDDTDFTATDGVNITLATAALSGDLVRIVAWLPRGLSDGYLKAEADAKYVALTGDQTVAGVKTLSSNPIVSSGTANGVAYLNGSKVLTTGSALVFDGSNLGLGVTPSAWAGAPALDIGSWAGIGGVSGTSAVAVTSNAYYNSGWKYKLGFGLKPSLYQAVDGAHSWYTAPSGTAGNAISFTQAMTLDANGDLQLGLTGSTGLRCTIGVNTSDGNGMQIRNANNGAYASLYVLGSNGYGISGWANSTLLESVPASTGGLVFSAYSGNIIFQTGARAERARIDSSGNLLVGRTAQAGAGNGRIALSYPGNSSWGLSIQDTSGTATVYPMVFMNSSGTGVGSIASNSTSTAYNTSSDYRLKNITGPVTDSGAFIDALQPKQGTWKVDGSKFVGFLAHEFAEVSPSSVSGEKDAVNDNGPVYQAMQASSPEVMANIIAELQSLRARVAQLEMKEVA